MGQFGKLHLPDVLKSSSQWFNKYVLTLLAFFIWMTFFDSHSIINQIKLNNAVSTLEKEKMNYEEALKQALKDREVIENDLEKYAREKYLFHKENEDIIIFK